VNESVVARAYADGIAQIFLALRLLQLEVLDLKGRVIATHSPIAPLDEGCAVCSEVAVTMSCSPSKPR